MITMEIFDFDSFYQWSWGFVSVLFWAQKGKSFDGDDFGVGVALVGRYARLFYKLKCPESATNYCWDCVDVSFFYDYENSERKEACLQIQGDSRQMKRWQTWISYGQSGSHRFGNSAWDLCL